MLKKEKGITLIALVITIVILIILAVISINMVFNENGIVKKAEEAKNYQLNAEAKEKEMIETLDNAIKGKITGKYIDSVLVNAPKLSDGMTPIYWDGSNWVETTQSDSNWYNYSQKKWANVKLEDGSMLVWIPRYAYKITSGWHNNKTGTIEVVFVGTDNKSRDGTIYDGTYKDAVSGINTGEGMKHFVVNPAFDYGDKKLEGFWVGKFETSHTGCTRDVVTGEATYTGNEIIQIKPNITSWRNMTIGNAFATCLAMNKENNSYGLNANDHIVDPHMMKNTEWGACAYLSKSKYGKETEEVFINNSSDYITGNAGNTAGEDMTAGVVNEYHTPAGQKASTTGNIYGIYDMSGGNWERVAAYLDNNNESLTLYGNSVILADEKYKNKYELGITDTKGENYKMASEKYGDAIYETSNQWNTRNGSWYEDDSNYINTTSPFLVRGGYCGRKTEAGMFAFDIVPGNGTAARGFRVIIPVLS